MSVIDDIRRQNEQRAEEQRKANEEHMKELEQKTAANEHAVQTSTKEAWIKRSARWSLVKSLPR